MIISVGYRVNSYRGVQFRQWATQVLKEYMIKGFALNDELLKNAGRGNYFDELLARIRDIRSSEKMFYRKILEIYALSIDYDPRTEITQQFFKTVQNKMHFSAHGHTAAEVIPLKWLKKKPIWNMTALRNALKINCPQWKSTLLSRLKRKGRNSKAKNKGNQRFTLHLVFKDKRYGQDYQKARYDVW